ncbi:hypothetical protein OKW48_000013 [Paraburkholderia youngii]
MGATPSAINAPFHRDLRRLAHAALAGVLVQVEEIVDGGRRGFQLAAVVCIDGGPHHRADGAIADRARQEVAGVAECLLVELGDQAFVASGDRVVGFEVDQIPGRVLRLLHCLQLGEAAIVGLGGKLVAGFRGERFEPCFFRGRFIRTAEGDDGNRIGRVNRGGGKQPERACPEGGSE